jgi:hypothetical protein
MKPSDFYTFVEIPERVGHVGFNADLVEQLRLQPEEDTSDLESAYGLTQLARDELVAHGPGGRRQLDGEDLSVVPRSPRATLTSGFRLG